MKNIIPIVFLFLSLIVVNAQNNKKTIVTYDIQYNTEVPNVKQGVLEISGDKKESVFLITSNEKYKKAQKIDEGTVAIRTAISKERFVYSNYNTGVLYSTEKIFSKKLFGN